MDLKVPLFRINEGQAAGTWPKFKQNLEIFLSASGIDADEKRKCNLLLHCMGPEGVDIYNTFELKKEEVNKYSVLIDKFDNYFLPKINVTFERHKFFTRNKKPGENFDAYVTELKSLASTCEFGKLKDSLIKDRIVCGIESDKLRKKLLVETNLNLNKCIDICKSSELTQAHTKQISTETVHVDKVNKQNRNQKPNYQNKKAKKSSGKFQSSIINNCTRCGRTHKINECPAYGKECFKCKRSNHFGKMCKAKEVKEIRQSESEQLSDDEGDEIFIGAVESGTSYKEEDWNEIIQVMDSPRVFVKFKLDTGAQACIIPNNMFAKIPKVKLSESKVKLINYNGTKINNLGKCNLLCNVKDKKDKINLEFQIVEAGNNSPAILGLEACKKLKLIKRINEVKSVENLTIEFKDVFEGVGCLQNEHKIIIKENSVPVVYNARKIPLSIKNDLKKELDNLEKLEIIEKVDEPTDWVHPMVVVRKPNGKIRICLDPVELNKVIKREFFQIPTVEELLTELSGAKVFSILDANQGFYQIPLDDQSKKLCTFATPFGRYMFSRLPFGVSSAPEVFHKQFKQIFEGIPGQISYIDDLLVFGKNQKEHDNNLRKVLEKAREKNIKFNQTKCKFSLNEIKFVGHIIGSFGVKPDNEKIKSIMEMPLPKNKNDLERFLGMVTYVAKFIPNLSEVTTNLRQLLKKNVLFQWDENHTLTFNKIKKLLSTEPVLQYYNPNKPVVISVDASQNGLGAVLLQDNLPVIYSSRSLTECEKGYAQIEKELLAIVFGCSRFHQYIYSKKVVVESDHKPLVSIHKKPLIKAPLRLQRMLIKLQLYDLKITYKPGSQLLLADCLSRNSIKEIYKQDDVIQNEIEAQINLIEKILPISDAKFKIIQTETKKDIILKELLNIVKTGWSENKLSLSEEIQKYWNYRDEIVSVNDVLFKGNKMIVPTALRNEMLQIIHYNHLGINKCQLRARQCLYWPNINRDIENYVNNCETCLNFRNTNANEPLIQSEIPGKPWETIGTDVYQFAGKNYLMVIDYFSKFIETAPLERLDSHHTINLLKSFFARHGLPKVIRSDNGTNYSSDTFRKFVESWNIKHITSSPTHAQANGMVERSIQTFKNMLRKAEHDNKDLFLCLLEYRTTPIDTNIPSPAQMLFNREINSLLPKFCIFEEDRKLTDIKQSLKNKQFKQKAEYDKTTKLRKDFERDDNVRVQKQDKTSWQPGQILNKINKPRTYIVKLENGSVVERNKKYLIKDTTNKKDPQVNLSHCNTNPEPRPKRLIKNPKRFADYDCTVNL